MNDFELQAYLRPLLKWWWLLVVSTLIAAVASALTSADQPPLYRSRTTLVVGTALFAANPSGTEFSLANELATAYADIARRSTVQDATRQALGLTRLPDYTVLPVPRTQIIEIAVLDIDPARAQAVAAELVNQLMLQTPGGRAETEHQSFVDQQLNQIEASIVATQEEIEHRKQELETLFSARQIVDTNTQIAALESKLAALQTNYAAMLANSRRGATNTIRVLEPANLPTTPEESRVVLYVLTAGLLGFALAAAGAYTIEYLDNTLRTEQDALRHLELATLGQLPRTGKRGAGHEQLALATNVRSPAVDAYAGLRLALGLTTPHQPLRLLLISSSGAGEDKSSVAANLAIELARCGQNVILVDADLHRPAQQRLFKLRNHTGLTTLLQGEDLDVGLIVQQTETPGLTVLTSGPLPLNSAQLLSSPRMKAVLYQLREQADIIVLDTSPITATVDASILATQTDGVLLVLAAGKTRHGPAKLAVKLLRQIHANVLGVVFSGVPLKQVTFNSGHGYKVAGMHMETAAKEAGDFHSNRNRPPQRPMPTNGANGRTPDPSKLPH